TVPGMEKERRNRIRALNEEFAEAAVGQALAPVENAFADVSAVLQHLAAVKSDIISSFDIFLNAAEEGDSSVTRTFNSARDARFRRYMVNVIVGEDAFAGAPIVIEDHP